MNKIKSEAVIVSILDDGLDGWEPEAFYPRSVLEAAPEWACELPEFFKRGTLTCGDKVIKLGTDGGIWTVAYCWTKRG